MSRTAHLMIIDDDDDIRDTVVQVLSDEGYRVSAARHGEDALEQLRAADALPDLILLDLRMPVMDGATFRQEQLADPRLRDVPVIVLSADATAAQQTATMQARGHLKKPVNLDTLLAAITAVCG